MEKKNTTSITETLKHASSDISFHINNVKSYTMTVHGNGTIKIRDYVIGTQI